MYVHLPAHILCTSCVITLRILRANRNYACTLVSVLCVFFKFFLFRVQDHLEHACARQLSRKTFPVHRLYTVGGHCPRDDAREDSARCLCARTAVYPTGNTGYLSSVRPCDGFKDVGAAVFEGFYI